MAQLMTTQYISKLILDECKARGYYQTKNRRGLEVDRIDKKPMATIGAYHTVINGKPIQIRIDAELGYGHGVEVLVFFRYMLLGTHQLTSGYFVAPLVSKFAGLAVPYVKKSDAQNTANVLIGKIFAKLEDDIKSILSVDMNGKPY